MRFINLPKIAGHAAFLLALAIVPVLSVDAQNSNTGGSSMANSNTGSSSSQMANSNTGRANTTAPANTTTRVEATNTPRTEATTTPRTQVQTVVEKESSFPWGLLGLLGLAGLIPKKRSVEVTGVRETRTTTDNRNDKSNH